MLPEQFSGHAVYRYLVKKDIAYILSVLACAVLLVFFVSHDQPGIFIVALAAEYFLSIHPISTSFTRN